MKLSAHQQKIFDAFDKKDTDIDVAVIYNRVYGDPGHATVRDMQQKLAPGFRAVNEKLKKGCIEPGVVKRTYRLNSRGA